MPKMYFEQTKPNKKGEHARYEILGFDEEKGTVLLKGKAVNPWSEPFDKEKFKAMGYRLVQVEDAEAE